MKNIEITVLALALSLMASAQVSAQTETPGSGTALRIASGKKGKGYSKLFADIRSVCGAQVELAEVETEGGLQNLTTLAANQADLGFVQVDTLQDMQGSDEAIGALLAVMPLNTNLLHVLALAEGSVVGEMTIMGKKVPGTGSRLFLRKFSDLKGLPVAVVGSARALGRVLDRRHALNIQFVDVDTDEDALAKLRSGEVAGMLSTSGWPSGPIQKLKRDAGVRLIPYDLAVQPPYQLVRKNYENLDAFNHSFLAAPNLLVTRPFSANGANSKAVATLQACIQKNLVNLQEGRFEAAWREVKDTTSTFGWPRFVGTGKR